MSLGDAVLGCQPLSPTLEGSEVQRKSEGGWERNRERLTKRELLKALPSAARPLTPPTLGGKALFGGWIRNCPSEIHDNILILQSVPSLPGTLANLFPPSPPYFLPLPSPLEAKGQAGPGLERRGPKGLHELLDERGWRGRYFRPRRRESEGNKFLSPILS